MKSSLIWRFALIFAVTILWAVSMFPLKDRDYFETFRKMADKQLRKYDQAGDTERVKAFDVMMAEAEATLKANSSMAPGTAIRDAAKGTMTRKRVALHEYIPVPTQPKASNALVLSRVRNAAAGKLKLGLDLQGGTEFVISFNAADVPEGRRVESVRDQIIEILRNRVDKQGISEPELKPTGPNAISLRMPSVTESDKADVRHTIKQPAKLEFRMVDPNNEQKVVEYKRDPKRFRPTPGYEYFEMEVERDGGTENEVLFLKSRPEEVKGEQVSRAMATFNEYGNYAISMSFDSAGAAAFARVTTQCVGQRLAIVLDGKVYSAPVIREAITGGNAEITGSFSPEEAQRLAGVIESGNLPVSIQIDSEFGTDPTLGSDSVRSGISASLWGMGLVVFFMIVYYRLTGVIAVIALSMNMLLILGTMTISRATFTMPGIAGIILTIGMAVDANVLIYERMREEIRNGKTIGNVVKAGYSRAFWAIFDSNLTTVLTAMVLYWYGTGPVRGFAVTLIIGLVASMFTALFVTRAIFDLLLYLDKIKTIKMMQLMKNPNYDYLKYRKMWVGISVACVVLSLGTALYRGKSGLSIDFVGGVQLAYRCEASQGDPDVGAVRAILEKKGYSDCRVGYKFAAAQGHRLLELVLPSRSTDEADFNDAAITQALTEGVPGVKFTLVQTTSIGGLIGARFQMQAMLALFLASLICIVYLAFRFEFAYGVAAVVAVLHDVIIAAGFFLLTGGLLSLTTLAALLTIMGFSLNDTIVIFDRVREDLGLHKGKSYVQIINQAVNETMSRTVLTSLTVWIVVWTLFLFGGGAINDFALIMLVGVVVGTYSTVFIASAIVAAWHKGSRVEEAKVAPRVAAAE